MTTASQDIGVRRRRWPRVLGGALLVVLIGLGACEALGWPFLSAPIQRSLAKALDRPVRFASDSANDGRIHDGRIHIGLLGGVRVRADYLFIGSPPWSQAPHTLVAQGAVLKLAYADLWRAWDGAPLHIASLDATAIDGHLERLADGRSSWQFGATPATPRPPRAMPTFGGLRVGSGQVDLADAVTDTQLSARFSLTDSSTPSASPSASAPAGLQLEGTGSYRKLPVKIDVKTHGVLALTGEGAERVAFPITLRANVGRARMSFDGTATDPINLDQLRGRFDVQGPSLAAVGDPLGITLPTTPAFRTKGLVLKEGQVWNAVFERADIGTSQLGGAFTFDPRSGRSVLSGRLTGKRLLLADLGPAVGAPERAGAVQAAPDVPPVAATRQRSDGKLLPNRPFDLPALRAMDANVLVDIADFDLGSALLQPLRPMRAHLVLTDGVLALNDIDARTADGRLAGRVQLDGRQTMALWTTDVQWADVRLENWLKQDRAENSPPYIAGRLNGAAKLAGQGRSTAAILGSLQGRVHMNLQDGSISHLAVEAAGLDVAQALGMLVKGDDALKLDCTVADLVADRGALTPRALVLDTADSTLWIDGSLSLATEAMDLRVVVTPKDFSPFALRTPIHVQGSFSDPSVSVEKRGLAIKAGSAAALALVNPLAAVLPFIDFGATDEARVGAAKCRAMAGRQMARINAPGLPAAASRRTP